MKEKEDKPKKKKGDNMKKHKERVRWEIVQLPDGEFIWIVKRSV